MSTVLVLDFDGTMTDAEAEGRPFRDGYLDDLCALVGKNAGDPDVLAIAEEVEAELAANPDKHPFLWMMRAVAPATVDPVFRAGAGAVLSSLRDTEAWIVTNSDTHAVASKVAALDRDVPGVAWLTSRVRGQARKFDVDDAWMGVDATLALPGLDRPVLLRRRAYHDILKTLLDGAGATFADLVVIGDIFELDLAMPLALGARVGLVGSARTPGYERAYVMAHPRATMIEDLADIPRFAFSRA
jgi:hypothetical protein